MKKEKRNVKITPEMLKRLKELNEAASRSGFDPVRDGRFKEDDYTGTVYNDISWGCTSGKSSEDDTIRLIVLGNVEDDKEKTRTK